MGGAVATVDLGRFAYVRFSPCICPSRRFSGLALGYRGSTLVLLLFCTGKMEQTPRPARSCRRGASADDDNCPLVQVWGERMKEPFQWQQ